MIGPYCKIDMIDVTSELSSSYLPLQILDADLRTAALHLLVKVIPFLLDQFDACEERGGLESRRQPLSL